MCVCPIVGVKRYLKQGGIAVEESEPDIETVSPADRSGHSHGDSQTESLVGMIY